MLRRDKKMGRNAVIRRDSDVCGCMAAERIVASDI